MSLPLGLAACLAAVVMRVSHQDDVSATEPKAA